MDTNNVQDKERGALEATFDGVAEGAGATGDNKGSVTNHYSEDPPRAVRNSWRWRSTLVLSDR
jgi:hypothetical protein